MFSEPFKNVTKELLSYLPERSRKVLSERYGLSVKGGERTLDAIGKDYGITRERVRQIENHGLGAIRQSEEYDKHQNTWAAFKRMIEDLGEIVAEQHLLAQ